MPDSVQSLINRKLSLITKSYIRYEGTVADIQAGDDLSDSLLTLSNVTVWGTEDRPAQQPFGKLQQIFPTITFKGSDIEDVDMDASGDALAGIPDPAIVHSQQVPSTTNLPGSPGFSTAVNAVVASSVTPRPSAVTSATSLPSSATVNISPSKPAAQSLTSTALTLSEKSENATDFNTKRETSYAQAAALNGEARHTSSSSAVTSGRTFSDGKNRGTAQQANRSRVDSDGFAAKPNNWRQSREQYNEQRTQYPNSRGQQQQSWRRPYVASTGTPRTGRTDVQGSEQIKEQSETTFAKTQEITLLMDKLRKGATIDDDKVKGQLTEFENQLFNKMKNDEEASKAKIDQVTVAYDPTSSFFDATTGDSNAEHDASTYRRERQQNAETFGIPTGNRGGSGGGYRGGGMRGGSQTRGGFVQSRGGGFGGRGRGRGAEDSLYGREGTGAFNFRGGSGFSVDRGGSYQGGYRAANGTLGGRGFYDRNVSDGNTPFEFRNNRSDGNVYRRTAGGDNAENGYGPQAYSQQQQRLKRDGGTNNYANNNHETNAGGNLGSFGGVHGSRSFTRGGGRGGGGSGFGNRGGTERGRTGFGRGGGRANAGNALPAWATE